MSDTVKEIITFDLTPDPKVLIALSHTNMAPLDALCELIDNSIDSFDIAKLQGAPIKQPIIWIDLPKKSDIENGVGILRIRDNGPGMTQEQAEKAIKAGYSGNNSFDSLGLFGMGFNISTSKLGRVTRFLTARLNDDYFIETVIDLEKINQTKSYQIEANKIIKSENFDQGTIIEISRWWPEGNSNNGFIKKLIQYGIPKIRQELGRRYATILRDKQIRILVDKSPCEPFEHCVWSSQRFVERNGNPIPARFDFDNVLGAQRRCGNCRAIIPDGENECPSCHSTLIRTVEERVKGWVGIQRFDDSTRFGIDLIRNGRAIKPAEKAAFFEYVDEFKNVIKDYPIDGQYGRIVGEVHLDFVPVDFLKQDFQRSSEEWQKAMKFLRGESSLQPKQPNADKNTSFIYKLYQGYRKVRECGKTDMYMGFWDPVENKPKRISRDIEKEYYQKFLAKEPGYYDDAKWWEKVEEASHKPIDALVECPVCGTQNLKETEICIGCGNILIGKTCVNEACGKKIAKSATTCQFCGTNQLPSVSFPWTCAVCGSQNKADNIICSHCGKEKGALNPLSVDYLLGISNKDDALSIDAFSIELSDGSFSGKLKVETYIANTSIISPKNNQRFPMLIDKSVGNIKLFIDPSHPIYANCNTPMEQIIADELAAYLFETNRNLVNYPDHTISNLTWKILQKYWLNHIEVSINTVKDSCENLMTHIKNRISAEISSDDSGLLYDEMSSAQSKVFVATLFEEKIDLSQVAELKKNGGFIKYVPDEFILQIFDYDPELFFNGKVWDENYKVDNPDIHKDILAAMYSQLVKEYRNSLETVIIFIQSPNGNNATLKKVDATIRFLESKLGEM